MSESILLVEDNAITLAQLNQALTTAGYQVTTAINGLDGYNKAQNQQFDLCIIDHLMPLMNGVQLLKNLQTLGELTPSNTIFLSTQDLKLVTQTAVIQFADKVLAKPISNKDIVEQVHSLLNCNSAVV
ncbi:response regulator [Thalassotalea sp. ND16A]|uniref:response regulator n=1 Tax=Thalassotalea sp. ND16A TaxID=1535422 RepID=UPI00051CD3C7|nr:response regulator [Thalassotalea sp. ND16A]KGK01029.1 response regulator receiver protein [Thalassotalea sp. ND16A]